MLSEQGRSAEIEGWGALLTAVPIPRSVQLTKGGVKMRLDFSGHNRDRVVELPVAELRRRFRRDTAYFHHNGNWSENNDAVTVTFNPTIYVNQDLQGQARDEAMIHEQRHLADFRRRASRLLTDLRQAVARRRYSTEYMRNRWAWFVYDLCVDSRNYHGSIGALMESCHEPSSPRP